jgi:hypothetical protein
MFLLLAGLAAYFFRNKVSGLVGLTISCSLLALLSAHGFLVAGAMFFVYAVRNFWPVSRNREYLPRFIACSATFAAVLLFAAVTSRSPNAFYMAPFPQAWYRTHPTFAFMLAGTDLGEAVAYGLTGEVASALMVLTVLWAWAGFRKRLLEFSPLVLLLAFLATVYCWPHHTGLIFITTVICAWMAWPHAWEQPSHADKLMRAMLVTVCSVQITWATVTAINDYRQPYTGAAEAAAFVRSLPQNSKVFGYGMANVAVQAYLPESPFANYDRKQRYWSHDVNNPIDREYARVGKDHPDYILNSGIAEKDLGMLAVHEFARAGYVKTHMFCGELFFQFSSYQSSCYAVYEPRTKQAHAGTPVMVRTQGR